MVKGILVGILAGAVCAGIWAAIIHYASMELGILAWAVGGAVGFGVAIGA